MDFHPQYEPHLIYLQKQKSKLIEYSVRVVNNGLSFIYFISFLFYFHFSIYLIFDFILLFFILDLDKRYDMMSHMLQRIIEV